MLGAKAGAVLQAHLKRTITKEVKEDSLNQQPKVRRVVNGETVAKVDLPLNTNDLTAGIAQMQESITASLVMSELPVLANPYNLIWPQEDEPLPVSLTSDFVSSA
ncbi:hypothetical protein M422DRAFT_53892 [Sphaerobolus stellatus SS14]|uniref:Unplaced genomic scaffold SPHSTscaffold_193, whole genome shotgun sequence n=1 Tax=Sphaerobolus stellatus (strain SS14) TaxID=990650 RepID=A0A0C9UMS7_SPHS4|nr:hypothetical protein M422DRAFT_53892 [Sphaerobolus stellatus SS14]